MTASLEDALSAAFLSLQECGSARAAYERADDVLAASEQRPGLAQLVLAAFLENPASYWKSAVLARMADEDLQVEHPRLMAVLVDLLLSESESVARSAALMLMNGGASSEEALADSLSRQAPRLESLRHFIAFARESCGQ